MPYRFFFGKDNEKPQKIESTAVLLWVIHNIQRDNSELNDEGKFYIPDSERNYYVFEYGDAMDSEELKAFFYSKWEELHRIPSYFDPTFKDSSYDQSTGVIKGRTREYKDLMGKVWFDYSFKIQFRDGRIRIDSPSIEVVYSDSRVKNLQSWIYNSFWKYYIEDRRHLIETASNGVINELLAHAEDNGDKSWRKTCELGDGDTQYITLGEDGSFRFVNSKDSSFGIFEINGYSKTQLMEMYVKGMEIVGKDYYSNSYYGYSLYGGKKWHTIDQFTDALSFSGYPGFETGLPNLFSPKPIKTQCKYYYDGYVEFQDNFIRVYVPKINEVKYFPDDNHSKYSTFSDFFGLHFIGKDGHFKERGVDGVNSINRAFNIALFRPIYLIYVAIEAANAPEEEW